MHEPSVRVLKAIAAALDLSADVLLAEAGLLERAVGRPVVAASSSVSGTSPTDQGAGRGADAGPTNVERAVNADPRLAVEQKAALIQVSQLPGGRRPRTRDGAGSRHRLTRSRPPVRGAPADVEILRMNWVERLGGPLRRGLRLGGGDVDDRGVTGPQRPGFPAGPVGRLLGAGHLGTRLWPWPARPRPRRRRRRRWPGQREALVGVDDLGGEAELDLDHLLRRGQLGDRRAGWAALWEGARYGRRSSRRWGRPRTPWASAKRSSARAAAPGGRRSSPSRSTCRLSSGVRRGAERCARGVLS